MATAKVYKFHYPNITDTNHPNEDYTIATDNEFAVFDGVPFLHQNPYPNPSPAAKAAEIGAKSVIEKIKTNSESPMKLLREAFLYANQEIRKFNESIGKTPDTVDFLNIQYAATVGAFGFIKNDILYFGQINDCGVMIFDAVGNKEVDFILSSKPYVDYLGLLEKSNKFVAGSKEEHQFVRGKIVNNKNIEVNGVGINFGVMTGEEKASNFFHYGASNISKGQICLFYSDGFIPFVNDSEFVKLLFKAKDMQEIDESVKLKVSSDTKYQKEKSLIIIRF